MGLLEKFKQGLQKTSEVLKTDLRDLFKSEGRMVDDEFLQQFEESLIKTDMGSRKVFGTNFVAALPRGTKCWIRQNKNSNYYWPNHSSPSNSPPKGQR